MLTKNFLSLSLSLSMALCSTCKGTSPKTRDIRHDKVEVPVAEPLDKQLQRESEALRSQIVTNAGRQHGQSLDRGGLQGLPAEVFEQAAMACTRDLSRLIRYRADVTASGNLSRIVIVHSSGSSACDDAVMNALRRGTWRACVENGLPHACTVEGMVSLPSAAHRPEAVQKR
jgi:Gram-negative bacterial tonB protein.